MYMLRGLNTHSVFRDNLLFKYSSPLFLPKCPKHSSMFCTQAAVCCSPYPEAVQNISVRLCSDFWY